MPCTSAIAALIPALALVAAQPSEPVVIGTEAAFPPYIFQDEAGQLGGFDYEVGQEICRRAELDCAWQVAPFDALIPGVISGRFDLAISGIAVTPERDRVIDYSIPYTDAGGTDYFVGLPGAPGVDAARIGVQSGTIHETHLRETGRAFQTYRSEAALIDALIAREIDLAYGPFDSAERTERFTDAGIELLIEEGIESDGVAMVVCEGNRALKDKLDAAIVAMQDDGTLDALSNEWF